MHLSMTLDPTYVPETTTRPVTFTATNHRVKTDPYTSIQMDGPDGTVSVFVNDPKHLRTLAAVLTAAADERDAIRVRAEDDAALKALEAAADQAAALKATAERHGASASTTAATFTAGA